MDKSNYHYRIYFVDGTTAIISEEEFNFMVDAKSPYVITADNRLSINQEHVTHAEREAVISEASAYIPPKEPDQIKEELEKQRVERISDLGSVIESHKETSDDSNMS